VTRDSLRALVVDDERLARVRLRQLLADHPAVTIVAEAASVDEAARAIGDHAPDVVFLDVQMPGGSGLTLFERCAIDADVVFVTAFDQYAVRAFDAGALDYLLKPIDPERLAVTIERLQARDGPRPITGALADAQRIALVTTRGLIVVTPAQISHIVGADDYSELFLADGTSQLSNHRLADWEQRLEPAGFRRVHRQAIVNLARIVALERAGSSVVVRLRGVGRPLTVARRRVAALRAELDKLR